MLLTDAQNARGRLLKIESAGSNIEEARVLADMRNELEEFSTRLAELAKRHSLLISEGVPLSPLPEVVRVKQLISQLNDRFKESPKSSTLVDKRRWSNLTSRLSEFCGASDTQQKQDWKQYFKNSLFAGVSPEERKKTIQESLPENRKALADYKRLYDRFGRFRNVVPGTRDELYDLRRCSEELSQIKFEENEDIPAPVRAFLNSTSGGSGARLELVIPEVIEWLRAKNMLDSYVVRAKM